MLKPKWIEALNFFFLLNINGLKIPNYGLTMESILFHACFPIQKELYEESRRTCKEGSNPDLNVMEATWLVVVFTVVLRHLRVGVVFVFNFLCFSIKRKRERIAGMCVWEVFYVCVFIVS